jgi:hypothetical protein
MMMALVMSATTVSWSQTLIKLMMTTMASAMLVTLA